jgi:hypothetical protein|tara:strand:+ start:1255 stop:1413 length:159 start_codon:yes stop_codon:yes gene_type:complete
MWTFIDGYKSYIMAALLGVEGALIANGVELPEGTTELLLGLLGAALRHGMKK